MRKFMISTAASLAATVALAAPASAATVINLTEANGSLTGGFEQTITTGSVASPAAFSSEFTFELPLAGVTSASISTVRTMMLNTDLDFTSVLLNGQALALSPRGPGEFGFIFNLPTTSGIQNLVVNGISRGNGTFAGTVSFAPTAPIPEPTTWALLLLGFAAVGFSMRRSKPSAQEARVRYNFA